MQLAVNGDNSTAAQKSQVLYATVELLHAGMHKPQQAAS